LTPAMGISLGTVGEGRQAGSQVSHQGEQGQWLRVKGRSHNRGEQSKWWQSASTNCWYNNIFAV